MDEVDSIMVVGNPEASISTSAGADDGDTSSPQKILLFYHFHPLSKDREIVELYRSALENLCQGLQLQGRILVGCNDYQSEGINGTLSGSSSATEAFVHALTRPPTNERNDATSYHVPEATMEILATFWRECDDFYQKAGCSNNPLVMDPSEFKWSTCTESQLFPDLNVKIVKELIGTGGVLAPISLDDVHKGYLTPEEWHDRMAQLQCDEKSKEDTILIDCRNTKEWQIGHFPGAPDPSTTTFNQFPHWVQQHSQTLANKNVLMYCTGGIRCEKASAFIRNQIPSVKEVRHLKGGIHKYLDQYGSTEECLWKGKNFVFDGRGAQAAGGAAPQTAVSPSQRSDNKNDIVGTCLYCPAPFDVFEPGCVCTVCREPTLVCPNCREGLREFHCHNHAHVRTCYFTDLTPYTKIELETQLDELQDLIAEIAVGKKFKQKRKTLSKQCEKIALRLAEIDGLNGDATSMLMEQSELKCRNCGEAGCSGRCWGFHGLKRKRILEEMHHKHQDSQSSRGAVESPAATSISKKADLKLKNNAHLQQQKALDRQMAADELLQLNLTSPPSTDRDNTTGIRIPQTCTRFLQSNTKGKWCGKSLLSVLQREFSELAQTETLTAILQRGLLRVNGKAIQSLEEAESLKLKNMDVVGRVTHWHEPPVQLPRSDIGVQKIELPVLVQEVYDLQGNADIFVCDKPSTVPVHPAGPYLSNSLTMMVEAQEGLSPKTLIPCHRIDRVTSGLTICCTNPKVAHLVQSRIDLGLVKKQYLAKVHGRFPGTPVEMKPGASTTTDNLAKCSWSEEKEGMLEVNAPIETVDPSNGIRKITSQGKPARSLFRFIAYDEATNTSMILCSPRTGRSHQLRVHLQCLGHSIVNDVQYGGTMDPNLDLSAGLNEANTRRAKIQESDDEVSLHPPSVSKEDSKAATELCPFCTKGPEEAFSPAQLLQGGHQICLHAFRYRIPFHAKKSGTGNNDDPLLGEVNLEVGLPPWAFGTDLLTNFTSFS